MRNSVSVSSTNDNERCKDCRDNHKEVVTPCGGQSDGGAFVGTGTEVVITGRMDGGVLQVQVGRDAHILRMAGMSIKRFSRDKCPSAQGVTSKLAKA